MTTLELQSLIESAQKGEKDAFRVLYNLLSPRIFKFIRPRARSRAEALDVLQDVFIDFWKGIDRFNYENDKAVEAFLFLVAKRKLSRSFRFWRSYISLEEIEDVLVDEKTDEGIALDATFILAKIKQRDRELIVLKNFEGRTFSEISKILKESENTLKVRYHRALKRIRNKIKYEE